jgi:hypothetical protein
MSRQSQPRQGAGDQAPRARRSRVALFFTAFGVFLLGMWAHLRYSYLEQVGERRGPEADEFRIPRDSILLA